MSVRVIQRAKNVLQLIKLYHLDRLIKTHLFILLVLVTVSEINKLVGLKIWCGMPNFTSYLGSK